MKTWISTFGSALLLLFVIIGLVACEKKEEAKPEATKEENAEKKPQEEATPAPEAPEKGEELPEAQPLPEKGAAPEATPEPKEIAPVPVAPPEEVMLLVAADGVLILDAKGEQKGVLTDMPTQTVRFASDRASVLLLSEGAQALYRIPMEEGEPQHVADLPTTFTVPTATADFPAGEVVGLDIMDLQSATDFWVSDTHACITLMDRNLNMMNVEASIAVTLQTGEVVYHVNTIDESLGAPTGCERRPAATPPPACAYQVNEESALVKSDTNDLVAELGVARDFGLWSTSTTGKWALISGNVTEGDYINMELFLMSCESGEVFPVVDGPWPAAIPVGQLPALELDGTPNILMVSGESSVVWLPGKDKLIVDGVMITAGASSMTLNGELIL